MENEAILEANIAKGKSEGRIRLLQMFGPETNVFDATDEERLEAVRRGLDPIPPSLEEYRKRMLDYLGDKFLDATDIPPSDNGPERDDE